MKSAVLDVLCKADLSFRLSLLKKLILIFMSYLFLHLVCYNLCIEVAGLPNLYLCYSYAVVPVVCMDSMDKSV